MSLSWRNSVSMSVKCKIENYLKIAKIYTFKLWKIKKGKKETNKATSLQPWPDFILSRQNQQYTIMYVWQIAYNQIFAGIGSQFH